MSNLRVMLVERKPELVEAWRIHFASRTEVVPVAGDICATSCDAVVSPANSFGFMDGGLDLALSERFGWDLQERVQSLIRQRPLGELLIGEALVVETGDASVPWLLSAPTMRVPMHISRSVNAYLAMKAVLVACKQHRAEPPIRTVAIPGLGTGVGKLSCEVSAFQMWTAYEEVVLGKVAWPADFGDAQKQQLRLNPTGRIYD
jgi:O-acetyl-ADP-ribose deacetylase (regulator of RNase III)